MTPRTWLDISQASLIHNYQQIQRLLQPGVQCAVVIKNNAYGHGMVHIAQLLSEHDPFVWLCVAGTEEAALLRSQGIENQILVMSYIDTSYEVAIALNVCLMVCNYEAALQLSQAALQMKRTVRVHIKIDTGMCRLGVRLVDLEQFLLKIIKLPFLEVEGIFTHLSDPNTQDQTFTCQQLHEFQKAVTIAHLIIQKPLMVHACASGSLTRPEQYDMVRVGTTLYGAWKSDAQKLRYTAAVPDATLQHIITWKTRVIEIKEVSAGSYIGYNRTYYAARSLTIAVLPIGYADGYDRFLSNNAYVMIQNRLVPVIGIVSMNMTIIDITAVECISVGTEVVIMGDYEGIRVADYAQRLGTIPNEVTARLASTIPRFIVP